MRQYVIVVSIEVEAANEEAAVLAAQQMDDTAVVESVTELQEAANA